jgi:Tfp pilus assembly protein PilF/tRNA A-37 threonylcarbamoyl transferase component Bud32
MISEKWEHVKDLFAAALECAPADRKTFLAELSSEDPAAAEQVVELLSSYEKAGDFLNQPCAVASDFLEDLEADQQRFSPGEVLCERFRIVRLIGKGGMGEVYEAWDQDLEDHVALKTLRLEISTHELFTSRFRREIQLARKVTHPNVCRIFDSFQHHAGDTPIAVLSMELLQGQTLAEDLKKKGRLTVVEALPLAQQIIDGLNAVHAAGIIHRDLKPSNLILVPDGPGYHVKITDFGIAGRLPENPLHPTLTQTNNMLGTPDYMAPEQLENGHATIQSDIYSLGLVLYEMVTGSKPFSGSGAWKRLYEPARLPSRLSSHLPGHWSRTILCCLERDRGKRPSSAVEVLTLLTTPLPRRWLAKLLLTLAATLAVFFMVVMFRPHTINPEAQNAVDLAAVAIENQSKNGFLKAIEEYKRATLLDPKWAQPWAELAYAYAAATNARYIDGPTAIQEARRAALRAIELDPTLGKAHGALGWIQSLDFDEWPKAEESFRQALQFSPNDGAIHWWFGVHLRKKGRFKEAEEQDQMALTLTHQRDPNIWCELAFLYWTSGQISRLHEHLAQQLKTFPNFEMTPYLYARLLKLEGHFDEADKQLSFAEQLGFNPPTVLVERISLEEYKGDFDGARNNIRKLLDAGRTQEVDGLLLAGVYAGLHDNDSAFVALESAYQRKDSTLLSLATSPVLEPLRGDARYRSLLGRLHFSNQIMQQMEFNSHSSSGAFSQPRRTGTS